MSPFEVRQGTSPVILGLPHTGTDVPDDIWSRLNDNGRILADTDWHIHQPQRKPILPTASRASTSPITTRF